MTSVHVLVFFILILAQPLKPGGSGAIIARVLRGAPSEQAAREWAQADFAHEKTPEPSEIKQMLVVPVSDTLLTEDGEQKVDWAALPTPVQRQISPPGALLHYDAAFETERGQMMNIPPVNQAKADPSLDMTAAQVRDWLKKRSPQDAARNWDEKKDWFYIVFTTKQAVLIKAINSGVACIRYGKAVHGSPAGDESAGLLLWDVLNTYSPPVAAPPAAPAAH